MSIGEAILLSFGWLHTLSLYYANGRESEVMVNLHTDEHTIVNRPA